MPKEIKIINPTLEKNIELLVSLMRSEYGTQPGLLCEYEVYCLKSEDHGISYYSLTHSAAQLVPNAEVQKETSLRIDIFESTFEAEGCHGGILPVIQSIIFADGRAIFDKNQSYVIKEIHVRNDIPLDKPGKPNHTIRAAHREHYLASQLVHLGAHYQLLIDGDSAFLHMKRALGVTLNKYFGNIDGEDFLKLSCALLEQAPAQIHKIVTRGKHQGHTIIHCDLKPENILAVKHHGNWLITIIDMSLARARKGGQLVARTRQGNLMVLDGVMLKNYINKRPINYNAETDLYALYVCISQLAGSLSRAVASTKQLSKDLLNPNLSGLFHNMGFDKTTKTLLTDLIRHMLLDDRNKRASREFVLQSFKHVLANQTCSTNKSTQVPLTVPKITAEDLNQHVTVDLEQAIRNNKQLKPPISKFNTVKQWIEKYRQLDSNIDDAEKERFDHNIPHLNLTSFYIYYFLRFDLLKECDDNACTRLLLRHHKIIKPLQTNYDLPEVWRARFNRLIDKVPLLLTTIDEGLYTKLAILKRNISAILKIQICQRDSPLPAFLQKKLEEQLTMDYVLWCEQLPIFAKLFNNQYYILSQIKLLLAKAEPVFVVNHALAVKFQTWADRISSQAMNSVFPPQGVFAYFELIDDLLHELVLYNSSASQLSKMIEQYQLQGSIRFRLFTLPNHIDVLDLSDEKQIISLLKALKTYSAIIDLHKKLINSSSKLFEVVTKCKTDLIELLATPQEPSACLNMLQQLINYFNAAEYVEQLCDNFAIYHHLVKALRYLILDKASALELEKIQKEHLVEDLKNLNELDSSLEWLSISSQKTDLRTNYFKEIMKFYAAPGRYQAPPHVRGNSMFNSVHKNRAPITTAAVTNTEDTFVLDI